MDRRLTPFSGRIGHISLRGRIGDMPLTEGEEAQIAPPLTWLRATPSGAVDRQLIHGDRVTVIDRESGQAFVMAAKDGYCGWIDATTLAPPRAATHRVRTPATHLYPEPRVQAPPLLPLWLNAQITVTGENGAWAETRAGYIPKAHLAPLTPPAAEPAQKTALGTVSGAIEGGTGGATPDAAPGAISAAGSGAKWGAAPDPAAVAETLLHAPYLWAGNSVAGVDCSGLVQLSLHAAGLACPGDSDLQQVIGQEIPPDAPLQRNDLIFWKGHVAMMTSPTRLIHANGYTMSVAHEDLSAATTRISDHYGGNILARRRP